MNLILALVVLFDIESIVGSCDFNEREYYLWINNNMLKLNATTEENFYYDSGHECLYVNETYHAENILYFCK